MEQLRTILIAGLEALKIELADEQIEKLMAYLTLLQKWNKVYNLTAIRDPEEMLIKHLLDSLAVVPHIKENRIIDVGTGGGVPGIPLAICFPEKQVDLLDSNSKKTRFLIQAKAELGLVNTQVIHSRVEEYKPEPLYDAVISRAFASVQDMLEWTHHLLPDGGIWWAMKAQKEFEDLTKLPGLVKIEEVIELHVPKLDAERMLVKGSKQAI
ncbi:16S rRNA (guanine(527)-N(7))-methyltransferase RsmG [Thiomicrorhabdus lithotrophica]|uniref:Ribosomal RNA small subunit methyltransferase G n=1 Tax=Thiomicrorhabdus lithotrophica TaxID=2949997 RepID=A0ABY8CD83_9GAMM|nr:16S rRNA (guanine(527)-N(7))-methyltransferase RsmG [Thiomicrorhabdus lithotrophica]WEJ62625.1 16S rRNA (guanine(527)-N(7))-methyltransferase RsmG [Thiomicrorhabdus lithotrophica]